jgi:hypothetical protein
MHLYQIDDDGQLFMSADLCDWSDVAPYKIDVVIDVDGGLDAWIPTHADQCLYPSIFRSTTTIRSCRRVEAARYRTACRIVDQDGHRVLAHCGMATTGRDSSRVDSEALGARRGCRHSSVSGGPGHCSTIGSRTST